MNDEPDFLDFDPEFDDPDFNPDKLYECEYWRCGQLFEQKTSNHRYCRKACRSRQNKWQRAQDRKARKAAAKAAQQRG